MESIPENREERTPTFAKGMLVKLKANSMHNLPPGYRKTIKEEEVYRVLGVVPIEDDRGVLHTILCIGPHDIPEQDTNDYNQELSKEYRYRNVSVISADYFVPALH